MRLKEALSDADVQSQPQLVRCGAFEADLRKFRSGCSQLGDLTIDELNWRLIAKALFDPDSE